MKVSEIKIGETYNGVKVLEDLGCYRPNTSARFYRCLCPICGKEFELKAYNISKTGRCMACYTQNLLGKRFGKLTVIERAESRKSHSYWLCKCECGSYVKVEGGNLQSGGVKSCGCLLHHNPKRIESVKKAIREKVCKKVSSDFQFKDALSKHPLFSCWQGIMQRCYNSQSKYYHCYGGRGIKVCDRWAGESGFEHFVADMGPKPTRKHSIDRIDVNGDYCPENCRWATQKEQMNNMRRNTIIIIGNEEVTATEFCERYGMKRGVIYKPISRGVDINFIILNSNKYRTGKRGYYEGHINHNRVVSDEVVALLESKLTNQNN